VRTRDKILVLLLSIVALLLFWWGLTLYGLPRLALQVSRLLHPPERAVFLPQAELATAVEATLAALTLTPPPSVTPSATASPTVAGPTATLAPSETPTPMPTPIPDEVILTGAVHEYEKMNNCGPATLSMALTFWGWQGDQLVLREVLRPNGYVDDKNVSPTEMVTYVNSQTDWRALLRFNGRQETLKRLIAAGFPVLIEKGFEPPGEQWMGHYLLLTGYSDARERFIAQDSYIMADFPLPYADLAARWLDFNRPYVVVYPPEREAEVLAALGSDADARANLEAAVATAQVDSDSLTGRDRFFAFFNLGSSLVGLQRYPEAALAYDQAYTIYPTLAEAERPWRMLWYQQGPYAAYYYAGRYPDVVQLANVTLSFLRDPGLEESYYWRGLARQALGDTAAAQSDLERALWLNPGYDAAGAALATLATPVP
jgi:tetratricopeptide (TPR) repeat protein